MPSFRTVLFWLHLTAGLTAGIVILIMSATGVALTYQRQMQAWADRGSWRAPAGAEPLAVDALAARASANAGAPLSSLTVRSSRDELAQAAFSGRQGTSLVDPYTGAIVPPGPYSDRIRGFFRWNVELHRYLSQAGESRARGKAITGAANLLFLFVVVSGLYLWMPRRWSWSTIRPIIWFRRAPRGRPRHFNRHNTIGFWTAIPLAIVVASATVISYPWASDLAYRVMGDTPPPRAVAAGPAPTPAPQPAPPAPRPSLQRAVDEARSRVPEWRSITVRPPASASAPINVAIDAGDGGQPQKRGTLTVDAATGAVRQWEPFEAQSPGRRFRSLLRFAHTGEAAGLLGQTIAGIASAGAVYLVFTGLSLAMRRFASWWTRRGSAGPLGRPPVPRETPVRFPDAT